MRRHASDSYCRKQLSCINTNKVEMEREEGEKNKPYHSFQKESGKNDTLGLFFLPPDTVPVSFMSASKDQNHLSRKNWCFVERKVLCKRNCLLPVSSTLPDFYFSFLEKVTPHLMHNP